MTTTIPVQKTSKKSRWTLSDRGITNLFIWPTLILLILWNIFPLFYSLYLAFTNYSAIAKKPPVWVGFQNFSKSLNERPDLGLFFHNRSFHHPGRLA